jgi:hypothetical protein
MSDPDVMTIDLDDLTIGEVIEIEDLTGLPLDALQDTTLPKGRTLQAMAFISRRRVDPDFTFEDAANLKLNMASPDPTEGSGPTE